MAEVGIERIDVRTMWPHEARDFTPWLAEKENLDLLGEELCMKLELIQPEYSKGPLRLDILAREADTGKTVAIENQLEETDISHLDRLLAYAKECDAHVAIWVAPEFQHEYANVLYWLNEWTGEEIEFYGAKIEVIRRSSDARCEPRFRKVVYPGGPRYIQKYYDFFQPLIDKLIETGFAAEARLYFKCYTGRAFPSCLNGVWYVASFERKNGKDYAWVTLHMDEAENNTLTKEIFDQLWDDREQIQACIACDPAPEWCWCKHDNDRDKFSTINIRRAGSVDDSSRELEETREWMLDLLPKFQKVFDPRVAKILVQHPLPLA